MEPENAFPRDGENLEVLMVEDSAGDAVLMEEALKELRLKAHLSIVSDGNKAMDYLYRREPYGGAKSPDLIVLDLHLPKRDGLSVLREIREDGDLKNIPVVVLTASRSEKDILKTYGLGGTLYVCKPLGFYEFIECVKSITGSLLKPLPAAGRAG